MKVSSDESQYGMMVKSVNSVARLPELEYQLY